MVREKSCHRNQSACLMTHYSPYASPLEQLLIPRIKRKISFGFCPVRRLYPGEHLSHVHHGRHSVKMHHDPRDDPEVIPSAHSCRSDVKMVGMKCCHVLEHIKRCRNAQLRVAVTHARQYHHISSVSASHFTHISICLRSPFLI